MLAGARDTVARKLLAWMAFAGALASSAPAQTSLESVVNSPASTDSIRTASPNILPSLHTMYDKYREGSQQKLSGNNEEHKSAVKECETIDGVLNLSPMIVYDHLLDASSDFYKGAAEPLLSMLDPEMRKLYQLVIDMRQVLYNTPLSEQEVKSQEEYINKQDPFRHSTIFRKVGPFDIVRVQNNAQVEWVDRNGFIQQRRGQVVFAHHYTPLDDGQVHITEFKIQRGELARESVHDNGKYVGTKAEYDDVGAIIHARKLMPSNGWSDWVQVYTMTGAVRTADLAQRAASLMRQGFMRTELYDSRTRPVKAPPRNFLSNY